MLTAKEAMRMSNEELREYLSEMPLNSQDLRELIYRLVKEANQYKEAWEYKSEELKKHEKFIENLKIKLDI